MAIVQSFRVLLILRLLQALAWSFLMTAIATWYVEFLPTKRRGPMMAMYSLGWPAGRFLVIWVASKTNDSAEAVWLVGAVNFAILSALIFLASESPRFLLVRGKTESAHQILRSMCSQSGHEWNGDIILKAEPHSNGHSTTTNCTRMAKINQEHRTLLLFSFMVFACLSITTVLLDTWGPSVYHKLMSPGEPELPHFVLSLFNLGDMCGIVLSIFLADRIGRRGSFIIGFFVQASLLGAMVTTSVLVPRAVATLAVFLGMLSSSCRCFGWEAAHMWTLEAFPTDLRAMAFGVATAFMRVCSIGAVQISSLFVKSMSPQRALSTIAFMMVVSGVLVLQAFPKETAGEPMTEYGDGSSQRK